MTKKIFVYFGTLSEILYYFYELAKMNLQILHLYVRTDR